MSIIGRGAFDGPVTTYVKLSASTASTPAIAITATSAAGGGTAVHVADLFAYDVLQAYAFNATAAPITAVMQAGTTATTTSMTITCAAGQYTVLAPNVPISGGGTLGVWMANATGGLSVWGQVARTFAT